MYIMVNSTLKPKMYIVPSNKEAVSFLSQPDNNHWRIVYAKMASSRSIRGETKKSFQVKSR